MKRTYTRTLMKADLSNAKVTLDIYNVDKYTADAVDFEDCIHVEYDGIKSWSVIEGGKEAEAIEMLSDMVDEHHEYLVIELLDGSLATYRNSHVDMFLL